MTNHRVLAGLLLASLLVASATVATHTDEDALGNPAFHEDFEEPRNTAFFAPGTPGPKPYTALTSGTGSGTSLVNTPTTDLQGSLSWKITKTAASGTFNAMLDFGANYDLCDQENSVMEFEYVWDSAGTMSQVFGFVDQTPLGASFGLMGFSLATGTGVLTAIMGNGVTVSETGVFPTVLTQDTKYTFRIQGVDCDNASVTFINMNTGESVSLDETGTGHVFSALRYFSIGTAGTTTTAVMTSWVDSMTLPGVTLDAGSGSPSLTNSVTVSNLCGFDVDPTGALAIARVDCADSDVVTYTATTLTEGGTDPTNCNRFYGVTALKSHVAYFQCDSGDPNDVVSLSIRSGSLGSPDKSPVCSGASFCIENIDDEELEGAQDDQGDLVTIHEFPFDYTNVENDFLDDDAVYMAWGVTTTAGRAGVMSYTMNNNGDDKSDLDTILVDPSASSTPTQMCLVEDPDGRTFFYAGSDNSNVKGARVRFNKNQEGIGLSDTLEVTVTEIFPGTSSTAAPQGVACGWDRFAILNQDKLTLWERDGTAPYFTKTGLTGVPDRGVHMSQDGEWTAYVSDGSWHVLNNTNGQEVASASLPAGTFREMRLQGAGSNLWIATTTTIAVYAELFEFTTGSDEVFTGEPPTVDDEAAEPDSELFQEPSDAQIALFGSQRAVEGFRGLIMLIVGAAVGGVSVGAYAVNSKQKIPVAVVVAVAVACGCVATVAGWFFGIIEDWFLALTIALVVFVAVGAGIAKFRSN